MTRTTRTVTKEYDAKGKLVKETIVETTDSGPAPIVIQPWRYPVQPYVPSPTWISAPTTHTHTINPPPNTTPYRPQITCGGAITRADIK